MRYRRYLFLAAFLGAVVSTTAAADPVTFGFEGTLSFVGMQNALIAPGTSFSGTFTFDSELADGDPSPEGGVYGTRLNLVLELGPLSITQSVDPARPPFSLILVQNSVPRVVNGIITPIDSYEASINNLSGDGIGSAQPASWSIQLSSTDTTVFSDGSLPLLPPELDRFYAASMIMNFRGSTNAFNVVGPLSSLYLVPSPVPEPQNYALLLAGLGLLGFAAARRKA